MRIHVLKERQPGETRVAATPETVTRLVRAGHQVSVERGAGVAASYSDRAFEEAGAQVVESAASEAQVVLGVGPVSVGEVEVLPSECKLIAQLDPLGTPEITAALKKREITAFALELVPRITRAQSMDVLSSQASIAGYKAVLLAATKLDRYFPLLMTAAGTIQPSRVVVMGAGVAGLQAVATAKRLGAVVEVSDIRPEVREQVVSLGGRFIEVAGAESGAGEGGYAKEMTDDFMKRQQAVVRERIVQADIVITTALIPGRPAPRLVSADTVAQMKAGSVIVDMAVARGGNCELSVCGRTIEVNGVHIIGNPNLPATMAADASRLFARNVLAFFEHVFAHEDINEEDEIVRTSLLTRSGKSVNPRFGGKVTAASEVAA